MAKLVFLDPAFSGRDYRLVLERTTIGRSDANTLVIRHPSLSAIHCEILVNEPEVIVRDLGSRNGTVVNGVKLCNQQAQVKHGQIIRFGSVHARLELESEFESAATEITAMHEHWKTARSTSSRPPEEGPSILPPSSKPESSVEQTVLIPHGSTAIPLPPAPAAEKVAGRKSLHRALLVAAIVILAVSILVWILRIVIVR